MTVVVDEYPPNYDAIVAALGEPPAGTIFAYGDRIYSPHLNALKLPTLAPSLMLHEQVHLRQQADMGGPEPWWEEYLASPAFRLDQEVEAYRAEVKACDDRPSRREAVRRGAKILASGMYGFKISKEEARKMIAALDVREPR